MQKEIDFSKITACGECCVNCKKKAIGLCNEFPCEWLIEKVVWRPNVVEELTELALLFNKRTTSTE